MIIITRSNVNPHKANHTFCKISAAGWIECWLWSWRQQFMTEDLPLLWISWIFWFCKSLRKTKPEYSDILDISGKPNHNDMILHLRKPKPAWHEERGSGDVQWPVRSPFLFSTYLLSCFLVSCFTFSSFLFSLFNIFLCPVFLFPVSCFLFFTFSSFSFSSSFCFLISCFLIPPFAQFSFLLVCLYFCTSPILIFFVSCLKWSVEFPSLLSPFLFSFKSSSVFFMIFQSNPPVLCVLFPCVQITNSPYH